MTRILRRVFIVALAAVSAFFCFVPANAQTSTNAFGGLSKNSDKPIDIQSEALTVYTDQYALFSGNVRAVQGGTTLRARELKVHYVGSADGQEPGGEPAKQPAAGGVEQPTAGGVEQPAAPVSPTPPPLEEGKSASAMPAATPAERTARQTEPPAISAGQPAAQVASADPKPTSKDNAQAAVDEPIDIRSDWLLVHDKEKYAHFKGNVKVVQGDTRLLSQELKVNYSGGDGLTATTQTSASSPTQITKIEALGDVRARLAPKGSKATQSAKTGGSKPDAAPVPALTASSGQTAAGDAAKVARNAPRTAPATSGEAGLVSTPDRAAAIEPTTSTETASAEEPAPPAKKNKQITELEATGGVVITSENDETATSDWAVYNLASDLVTIGGNVVLTQNDTVLKGDRLVIDLKSGESRFENTGTTAEGGRRIRALFMPKNGEEPANDKNKKKKKKKAGGAGDSAARSQQTPSAGEAAVDDAEPLSLVPEFR